jgi:hypothetical protein
MATTENEDFFKKAKVLKSKTSKFSLNDVAKLMSFASYSTLIHNSKPVPKEFPKECYEGWLNELLNGSADDFIKNVNEQI